MNSAFITFQINYYGKMKNLIDTVLLVWGSFTVKLEAGGDRLRQSCLLTHR